MKAKIYLPEGMTRTERTTALNQHIRSVKPGICLERARLVTESYRRSQGEHVYVRRAKALDHVLRNMSIFILDDELIVGNHASRPRWAPLYPEAGIFDQKELSLFPERDVDTLQLSEDSKRELSETIYPYWIDTNTQDISRHHMSPATVKVLEAEHKVFDPTSRTRSGYGHYIPNIGKILVYGFKYIEEQAAQRLAALSPLDPQQTEKALFYRSALILCAAVRAFSQRYADEARKKAGRARNDRCRRELELIASVCEQVPYRPARSFHEALQSYWFTVLVDYISQNGSAISGGRFDQYMYPFFEKDLGSGFMSREEAQELLEALWIKHSDIIKASSFSSAKNNGGFATTIHLTLSGVGDSGADVTNELTYLCLDAEANVFNTEPNVGIRVHGSTPDRLLLKAVEILVRKNGGKLPFFNDNVIVPALCADGVRLDLARGYGIVGCVEPTPTGNTMGNTNACYFNLAKCLELALNDGRCRLCGRRMGPATGDPTRFTSLHELTDAFAAQVDYFVDHMISSLNSIETVLAAHLPHVYSSLLIDGCVESGVDATRGGATFNFIGVEGVGLADVADSLAAIDELAFRRRLVSMAELIDALDSNFAGSEDLRQLLLNKAPKYGNDEDEVDALAQFVVRTYCLAVRRGVLPRGGVYRPGLYCLSSNVPFGMNTGALPSGRKANTPLGDGGVSPKHGMDRNGPGAVVRSVAKIDHALAINGTNLNQRYSPSALQGEENRQRLVDLIRTYFDLGGLHIQFNIVSSETLLEAQKHPEDYRSLVVRVAGYSAFFVDLDKAIQDEIIARTVMEYI